MRSHAEWDKLRQTLQYKNFRMEKEIKDLKRRLQNGKLRIKDKGAMVYTVMEKLAPVIGLKRATIPDFPSCVYFLLFDSDVIYVGQSVNLLRRIEQHDRTNMVFDQVLFVPVPCEYRKEIESAFITIMAPEFNRYTDSSLTKEGALAILKKHDLWGEGISTNGGETG